MRYSEIIETTTGEKVWKATKQRHEAQRTYQDTMRSITQTTPAPKVGAKQAKARQKCQSALSRADDSIRRAATSPR